MSVTSMVATDPAGTVGRSKNTSNSENVKLARPFQFKVLSVQELEVMFQRFALEAEADLGTNFNRAATT